MNDTESQVRRGISVKMPLQCKEMLKNRNIPHAVVMREYGSSRCLNQLSSEFRIAAEEKLILKKHKEMKCDLPDFTRSTYLMVFSPDGKKMASSHGNHNVYVTDVKTGKNLNTLSGHPRTPWCIAFHPSSNEILASGCLGGQVRVWDLLGGSEIWTVEGQTSIASLAFHPSERLLVIASYNEIMFWDWSQQEPFAKCSTLNEKEKIRYVAFDHTGTKLITGIEIPKPIISQWDRLGSSGPVNSPAGPSGPRPIGQRPGFGPVFSRPSQDLDTGSNPQGLIPTFNAQHRTSASQLEGRIRQDVQLLQLLLNARRSAQHDPNRSVPRRTPPQRSGVNESSRGNLFNSGSNVLSNTGVSPSNASPEIGNEPAAASSHDPNRARSLSSGSSQEMRESNHSAYSSQSEIPRVFGSGRLNGTSPSETLSTAPSLSVGSILNPSDEVDTSDAGFCEESSRPQNSEHSTDMLPEGSYELRHRNRQFPLSNLDSAPLNRNERLPLSRSSDLRSPNTSNSLHQSSTSSRSSDLTSQVNSLSEEIRRSLNILSEHVDDMQHCSVCLPRMNSSRLSHIQQLWAELREQIRSLQSSIWENTTLASNAWNRLSFEAITGMLMSQRDSELPSGSASSQTRSGSNADSQFSSNSCETNSASSALGSAGEGSSLSQTPLSGDLFHSTGSSVNRTRSSPSSCTREPSASSITIPSVNQINSIANSSNVSRHSTSATTSVRSRVHRTLFRSNRTHGLPSLRSQNVFGRQLGTTAGALRSQRAVSGRPTPLHPPLSQDSSTSDTFEHVSGTGPHLPNRTFLPTQSVETGTTSRQNVCAGERNATANSRIGDTSSSLDSNIPGQNLPIEGESNSIAQSQMSEPEHLYLVWRRISVLSQPFHNSRVRGTQLSLSQSSVFKAFRSKSQLSIHRFFGGRQSVFEASQDPPSSQTQGQRSRSLPHVQTPPRSADNMLMRILHSLRRAATLSGSDASQASSQTQSTQQQNDRVAQEQPEEEASEQNATPQPYHSNHNSSSGLRLWTQYSGPAGDVLHIRVPQMEQSDSPVQERLSRIRPNGTTNVVHGVMTEELARNLLHLHLHQQQLESQLRQHQLRLCARFYNQNTLRNVGQAQRELSRRLARCSLCGGSIHVSSHLIGRLETQSPDPPPAHSSSRSSERWRQYTVPLPNPVPAHIASRPPRHWWQESEQSAPPSVSLQLSPPSLVASHHHSSPSSSSTPSPPVSQISNTNPSLFGGNSSTQTSSFPNTRAKFTSSSLLFLQNPTIHNRSQSNQQSNNLPVSTSSGTPQFNDHQHQQGRVRTDAGQVLGSLDSQTGSSSSAPEVQRSSPLEVPSLDAPSTSTGIGGSCDSGRHLSPILPISDSSSDDSDRSVSRGPNQLITKYLRKSTHLEESSTAVEEKKSSKSQSDKLNETDAGSNCTVSSEQYQNSSLNTSCNKGNLLKRKNAENCSRKSAKVRATVVYSSSSDSDTTASESPMIFNNRRNISERKSVHGKEKGNRGRRYLRDSPNSQDSVPCRPGTQSASNTSRLETPPLQQLPVPTFTRQLDAIIGRLDHLMFLQRNALDPPLRERDGVSQDNSPLRNTGDSASGSPESRHTSDAINITSRLLTRLTESLSRQIQMVQQVRVQPNSCDEHQGSPRPGVMNIGVQANFAVINNTRRRGRELLNLMSDSLTTFSSHSSHSEEVESNPAFQHVQTMSAAFWLLQGLYVLLHLALELTDLLVNHYVFSYEPSDPDEGSITPVPQPCVCLSSNSSTLSPLQSRSPIGLSQSWNGAAGPIRSPNPRANGPLTMQSVHEALRSHIRSPRPTSTVGETSVSSSSPSSTSSVRRPWLVNLHHVLASARPSIRPSLPPPDLESFFRSRRYVQNESQGLAQIPVVPVPSYSSQVSDEASNESQDSQPSSTSYALVHPVTSSGTIRRNIPAASHAPAHQIFHQENSTSTQGPVASGTTRSGPLRLRSRLLQPPLIRQTHERPSFSSEADVAAQQSLFFHFDYTRNLGHLVREPSFATEEHRIHRIQLWDFSDGNIPDITKGDKNLVVAESKIHNDASVDISADGHLLVALLPAPRPTVHPQLPSSPAGQTVGVYSLVWESLGQLLYTTSLDQPAVSVALSPTAAYLLVGLATRRTMLMPNDQHVLAQIFRLEGAKPGRPIGARGRLNSYGKIEVENNHVSVGINCIRWAPVSGQGIVYGTNTGALVILR